MKPDINNYDYIMTVQLQQYKLMISLNELKWFGHDSFKRFLIPFTPYNPNAHNKLKFYNITDILHGDYNQLDSYNINLFNGEIYEILYNKKEIDSIINETMHIFKTHNSIFSQIINYIPQYIIDEFVNSLSYRLESIFMINNNHGLTSQSYLLFVVYRDNIILDIWYTSLDELIKNGYCTHMHSINIDILFGIYDTKEECIEMHNLIYPKFKGHTIQHLEDFYNTIKNNINNPLTEIDLE